MDVPDIDLLAIFVKRPQPGAVKTRLAAHTGPEWAAGLYSAFLGDLAEKFRQTADRRLLCYAPADEKARDHFTALAGGDYDLWPQPDQPLGDRLERLFAHAFGGGAGRVVAIGSDSPTLPEEFVRRAFALLGEHDCVLGPATDGGYYLIGQRARPRPVFGDIEWSTPRVLRQTVARIAACNARLALLPPWYDVDTPDDLELLRGHLQARQAAGDRLDAARTAGILDL